MLDNEFKLCAACAAVAAFVVLSSLAGCDKGRPSATSAVPIAEPQIVRDLRVSSESAAAESAAAGKDGKSAAGAGQVALKSAFEKAVAEGHLPEIEKFVEACVKAERDESIAYEIQAELVFEYVSRPSKPDLARVLSWGSTDTQSYWSIEDALTSDASWNKIADGLDVLFDAYEVAKSARAKDANYFAVWRALGDLPIKTKDQDEYMKAARPWYSENRARLVKQRGYDYMDFLFWRAGSWDHEPPHLFVLPDSQPR